MAEAGAYRHAHLGETVQFDGSASYDPDGGSITDYMWAIESAPPGSTAYFVDPNLVVPTLSIPEASENLGDYVISLIVSKDGGTSWSYPDTMELKVGTLYALGDDPDLQVVETRLTDNEFDQFDAAISGINAVYNRRPKRHGGRLPCRG